MEYLAEINNYCRPVTNEDISKILSENNEILDKIFEYTEYDYKIVNKETGYIETVSYTSLDKRYEEAMMEEYYGESSYKNYDLITLCYELTDDYVKEKDLKPGDVFYININDSEKCFTYCGTDKNIAILDPVFFSGQEKENVSFIDILENQEEILDLILVKDDEFKNVFNTVEIDCPENQKNTFSYGQYDFKPAGTINQIITGETGCGKTYTAIHDTLDTGKNFAYIAPCRQLAYETYMNYFDDRKDCLSTGEIKINEKGSGNFCGVFESFSEEDIKNYDTLIIDEAHFIKDEDRGQHLSNLISEARIQGKNIKLLTATRTFDLNDFEHVELASKFKVPEKVEISFDDSLEKIFEGKQTIWFVSSIEKARITASMLQDAGIKAVDITSKRKASEKLEAQLAFANKDLQVVVCTNLLGQGVNFECENLIIERDSFNTPELKLQKLGRLGRPNTLDGVEKVYYSSEEYIEKVKEEVNKKTKLSQSEVRGFDNNFEKVKYDILDSSTSVEWIKWEDYKYCLSETKKLCLDVLMDENKKNLHDKANTIYSDIVKEEDTIKELIQNNMRYKNNEIPKINLQIDPNPKALYNNPDYEDDYDYCKIRSKLYAFSKGLRFEDPTNYFFDSSALIDFYCKLNKTGWVKRKESEIINKEINLSFEKNLEKLVDKLGFSNTCKFIKYFKSSEEVLKLSNEEIKAALHVIENLNIDDSHEDWWNRKITEALRNAIPERTMEEKIKSCIKEIKIDDDIKEKFIDVLKNKESSIEEIVEIVQFSYSEYWGLNTDEKSKAFKNITNLIEQIYPENKRDEILNKLSLEDNNIAQTKEILKKINPYIFDELLKKIYVDGIKSMKDFMKTASEQILENQLTFKEVAEELTHIPSLKNDIGTKEEIAKKIEKIYNEEYEEEQTETHERP